MLRQRIAPCEGGGIYRGRTISGDHVATVGLAITSIVTRNRYENSATMSNCAGVSDNKCLEAISPAAQESPAQTWLG